MIITDIEVSPVHLHVEFTITFPTNRDFYKSNHSYSENQTNSNKLQYFRGHETRIFPV